MAYQIGCDWQMSTCRQFECGSKKPILKRVTILVPSIVLSLVAIMDYPIWFNLGKTYFDFRFQIIVIGYLCLYAYIFFFVLAALAVQLKKVVNYLCQLNYRKMLVDMLIALLIVGIPSLIHYFKPSASIPITDGLKQAVTDEVIRLPEIQNWLSQASELYVKMNYNEEKREDLPEAILSLCPKEVYVKKTKTGTKYIRLTHGGAPITYGIVIGVGSEDIPSNDIYSEGELRSDFLEEAFVWCKKRTP